jgi:serine/threonine protein kinase
MMNRRLRERLTEAEILQIFVDVCEGVAAMHNLRPALLHRDLKVENILQASNNVFKLCDFGSATPVAPRPPSTTAEVRALEADLNRHTTLQYRAPEMVDPYLRRSVDEKSDVWALGVLLYKLCYYTTPFEEHGPLAILNVQYRIPPYPVYSSQMNTLIGVLFFASIASKYTELFMQPPCFASTAHSDRQYLSSSLKYTPYEVPNRASPTTFLRLSPFPLELYSLHPPMLLTTSCLIVERQAQILPLNKPRQLSLRM